MTRSESQHFARRVCQYYENGGRRRKSTTVHHFEAEGKSRKTIYNILARYEASGDANFRPIPGRPVKVMTPKKVVKVEKAFRKCPSLSIRLASRKLGLAKSTLSYIKVKKLGITARTKKKAPKYVKDQEGRARRVVGRFLKKPGRKCW